MELERRASRASAAPDRSGMAALLYRLDGSLRGPEAPALELRGHEAALGGSLGSGSFRSTLKQPSGVATRAQKSSVNLSGKLRRKPSRLDGFADDRQNWRSVAGTIVISYRGNVEKSLSMRFGARSTPTRAIAGARRANGTGNASSREGRWCLGTTRSTYGPRDGFPNTALPRRGGPKPHPRTLDLRRTSAWSRSCAQFSSTNSSTYRLSVVALPATRRSGCISMAICVSTIIFIYFLRGTRAVGKETSVSEEPEAIEQ